MQKILVSTLLVLSFVSIGTAQAEHQKSINGLVLGAGGGALVGQALGRNTESTVIGTALGGVVGYIIGSEMDRDVYGYRAGSTHYRRPPAHRKKVVVQNNYYYEPQHSQMVYQHCKEAVLLGTVRGKARKMYATVCKTPRGWEIVPDEQVSYKDVRNGKHWRRKSHDRDRRHPREIARQRWVRHHDRY